jgi:hypothetical protein
MATFNGYGARIILRAVMNRSVPKKSRKNPPGAEKSVCSMP